MKQTKSFIIRPHQAEDEINRIYDEINQTELISSNQKNLDKCIEYNLNYILIDDEYNIKL